MRNIILVAFLGAIAIGAMQFPAWQDAKEQRAIAQDRVLDVIAAGTNHIDLSDLNALRRLPDNIGDIRNLTYLTVSNTNLRDLSGLEDAHTLEQLNINHTQVANLTPIAGLSTLRLVYLHGTWVRDVAPLATLPSLERVDIGKTQIGSLEPLTRVANLRWLNLHRSHAIDGSQDHFAVLQDRFFIDLSGGNAYRENYRPGWQYNATLQLNRLLERLGFIG